MKDDNMMDTMKYSLASQNNSGETGTVTFSEDESQKTKVVIEITGAPKEAVQPSHIHMGSCENIGNVKYPLTDVINGKSETILAISFDDLWKEVPFAVNVHKSANESKIYVACNNVTNDHSMMDDKTMESGKMIKESETMKEQNIKGEVLAGSSAPLLDFNKADYDAALKTDKLIVLYFYANWCPICRVEFPIMQNAFNELSTDKVIGFRVNYNDNQTDSDEVAIARQFGVAYQHTKVFVKNGVRILKSPEGWDDKRYDMEINKIKI
jgi:thiol-disulfide isomerase/thioredoxin